jgi:Glu-tRNA(Gln) amidotransferase subunit E-like FAD-binding protein
LLPNGRDMIGYPKVRILDDIRDLLRNGVTEVEERCVDALSQYLNLDNPQIIMEAELILYDLLVRYRLNESKKELVQKIDNELVRHFKYHQELAWSYPAPHTISFFVERVTDSRIPSLIRNMMRKVLEIMADKAAPYLIEHFENGDAVSQLEIKAFFMNTKERVKPLLEKLKSQESQADRKALIERILRFIDRD